MKVNKERGITNIGHEEGKENGKKKENKDDKAKKDE